MSYDINIIDKYNNIITINHKHNIIGGTYILGGTEELTFNITYNYRKSFENVFGKDGIRSLYGKTVKEVIPMLDNAINILKKDETNRYWDATEGNARKSLLALYNLCYLAPDDAIIKGD